MQVFVINLAAATERLSFMRNQLGCEFERIEAVRGCAVPEHLAANFSEPTKLLPGEIGCYASHLIAAEIIVARGLPYAVVLEDDVELASDFHHAVEAAVGGLGGEWDIVCLSGAKQHPHCRFLPLGSDRHLVRYLHLPKTTLAYLISQSGARKLFAQRRRNRPVDVDIRYGWEMGINGFGIYPPPAQPSRRFGSSIPKARRQRFYWRADPLGYLKGRIAGVHTLGVLNLIRAYMEESRLRN